MLKRLAIRAFESPLFVRALESASGASCTAVFMHRFAENREHEGRHDPHRLRKVLSGLRRAGVALVGLEEAVAYAGDRAGKHRKLAVSFTVDDGYADFADLAWPVFKEFDCPVSLFVVPGVINGDTWFWWDRLEWAMLRHHASRVVLAVGDERFEAHWGSDGERRLAFARCSAWLKQQSTPLVEQALRVYLREVEEPTPEAAPLEYRVLDWPTLRKLEQEGLRIGAHTMTHPVLSRCDDDRARWEVTESVRIVREQVANPLPVFCYPNGQVVDHGPREWQLVSEAGVPFAVTTTGGSLRPAMARANLANWQYRLPRFGFQLHAGQIIREFLT